MAWGGGWPSEVAGNDRTARRVQGSRPTYPGAGMEIKLRLEEDCGEVVIVMMVLEGVGNDE